MLLRELKSLTGVVEVGLFVGMAKEAFFGHEVSCFAGGGGAGRVLTAPLCALAQDGNVTHLVK